MPLRTRFQELLQPDRSGGDWLRRHSVFWVCLILILASSGVYWSQSVQLAFVRALMSSIVRYMPVTYLALYFVVPTLLQDRYQETLIRLGIWLVFAVGLRYLYQFHLPPRLLLYCAPGLLADTVIPHHSLRHLFGPGFMMANSLVIVAASLKLFRYQYQKEQANQQLARETLSIELQLLTAQIHPHFLFNTLNNIYSLTLRQSEKAAEVVQRLSALLRYMFQECNESMVDLSQEVELVRNYMALEQIRYGNRLTTTIQLAGDLVHYQIAPFLLLPFVENAFKHGASEQTSHAHISLNLSLSGDTLTCLLVNTRNSSASVANGQAGGLGLQNVRKRLALLYAGRHTLITRSEADWYRVELTIQVGSVPDRPSADSRSYQPVADSAYHSQTF